MKWETTHNQTQPKASHIHMVKLPWIFMGAPLNVNGAPGNIQGNLTGIHISCDVLLRCEGGSFSDASVIQQEQVEVNAYLSHEKTWVTFDPNTAKSPQVYISSKILYTHTYMLTCVSIAFKKCHPNACLYTVVPSCYKPVGCNDTVRLFNNLLAQRWWPDGRQSCQPGHRFVECRQPWSVGAVQ